MNFSFFHFSFKVYTFPWNMSAIFAQMVETPFKRVTFVKILHKPWISGVFWRMFNFFFYKYFTAAYVELLFNFLYKYFRLSGFYALELGRQLSVTSSLSQSACPTSWSTPPRDPATPTPSRRRMNSSVSPSLTVNIVPATLRLYFCIVCGFCK